MSKHWTECVDAPGYDLIIKALGGYREPDLVIMPDGTPYIYRWHLILRNEIGANVYLHLQVADDPERPLHDHPWDNQSVILAGGYREVYVEEPEIRWHEKERTARMGRVVQRRAEECHRLFLLPGEPFTITIFATGPVIRTWGFWFLTPPSVPGGLMRTSWRAFTDVIETTEDGRSIFKEPEHA